MGAAGAGAGVSEAGAGVGAGGAKEDFRWRGGEAQKKHNVNSAHWS